MTDQPPNVPGPDEPIEPPASQPWAAPPASQPWAAPPAPQPWATAPEATRLPFSKQAIWGFVISVLSIFVFGFIGVIGVILSSRAFQAARAGRVRGRGLAIAGMIIGAVGFLYYAVVQILRLTSHL